MLPEFFDNMSPQNVMTYDEYKKMIIDELKDINPDELEGLEREHYNHREINFQRINRLEKHFQISSELKNEIIKIKQPQVWMVITESWCGDSAQNLPVIAKVAQSNTNIDLKLILRDENPHIMDMFLTNGSRSIPILVAFDYQGNILFKWGPRPKSAQELVKKLTEEGMGKDDFIKQLHLWYVRNRGKDLDCEMADLMVQLTNKQLDHDNLAGHL